jgi:hypothetical protein
MGRQRGRKEDQVSEENEKTIEPQASPLKNIYTGSEAKEIDQTLIGLDTS